MGVPGTVSGSERRENPYKPFDSKVRFIPPVDKVRGYLDFISKDDGSYAVAQGGVAANSLIRASGTPVQPNTRNTVK
jgi:hypothetical protein